MIENLNLTINENDLQKKRRWYSENLEKVTNKQIFYVLGEEFDLESRVAVALEFLMRTTIKDERTENEERRGFEIRFVNVFRSEGDPFKTRVLAGVRNKRFSKRAITLVALLGCEGTEGLVHEEAVETAKYVFDRWRGWLGEDLRTLSISSPSKKAAVEAIELLLGERLSRGIYEEIAVHTIHPEVKEQINKHFEKTGVRRGAQVAGKLSKNLELDCGMPKIEDSRFKLSKLRELVFRRRYRRSADRKIKQ